MKNGVYCCEATRLRSRLISVVLGCLRQKPSWFENFGCMYITSFASISSIRNRGSFDSEELGPSKWYRSMWKRKSCSSSCRKPRFRGRRVWKQVKVIQVPMTKADLFLRIFDFAANNFDVKPGNTASLYADHEGRKSSKPHETWIEFFLNKFNCLLFTFFTVSYLNFYPLFVCFDKLWQLETTRARDNTRVREARNSRQNDLTWFDFFCRGNRQSSRSLAGLYRRKHK